VGFCVRFYVFEHGWLVGGEWISTPHSHLIAGFELVTFTDA
jgi:hypothetical protein